MTYDLDDSLFYLKVKNYMICSKYKEVMVEYNAEVLGMACRYEGIKLIISLNPTLVNDTIPDSCTKYIKNLNGTNIIDDLLEEGTYKMSPLLVLNGNVFLMTPYASTKYISYYTISDDYIDKSVHYEDLDTFYILVTESDSKDVDKLTAFIRSSEYIYPLNRIKIDPENVNKESEEMIPNLPNYPLINTMQNQFVYNSKDYTIVHEYRDEIYINAFHYIDKVINTLKVKYKDIKFYNSPDAIVNNDKITDVVPEMIIYTAEIGDYNNGSFVGHKILDPDYGYVWRHSVRIKFEYSCADLELLDRRRLDMHLDKFITGYAKDHLILNDGKFVGFPIIWDLQQLSETDTNAILTTVESGEEKYRLNFTCEMIIMTFRYVREYAGVIKHIITDILAIGKNENKEEVVQAFEDGIRPSDTTIISPEPYPEIPLENSGEPVIASIEGFDKFDLISEINNG